MYRTNLAGYFVNNNCRRFLNMDLTTWEHLWYGCLDVTALLHLAAHSHICTYSLNLTTHSGRDPDLRKRLRFYSQIMSLNYKNLSRFTTIIYFRCLPSTQVCNSLMSVLVQCLLIYRHLKTSPICIQPSGIFNTPAQFVLQTQFKDVGFLECFMLAVVIVLKAK